MTLQRYFAAGCAVAMVIALGTSGCSSEVASEVAPATAQATDSSPAAGTNGVLIPIESSNVHMAGYDASTSVMTVLFDSGGLYEYYSVPVQLWDAFVAAQPSPWSQVGYPQLVQGGYAYQKISP